MNKVIIILLAVVLVVVVSGCTAPPTGSNDGVSIASFNAEPYNVDENDIVSFNLDVENVGTTTASCVRADLLNVEGWRQQGSSITANIEGFYGEWDIESGEWKVYKKFRIDPCKIPWLNTIPGVCNLPPITVDMDCSGRDGCDLDVFWGDYKDKIACSTDTLNPYTSKWGKETLSPRVVSSDGRAEQPGDFRNTEWAISPPDLPEGTSSTYNAIARVTYLYKTTGSINIPALSEDEYDRIYTRGTTVTEPVLEEYSDSPVRLEIERIRSPIVVQVPDYRLGKQDIQVETIKFKLKNIGSGFPITGNVNGLIVGSIELSGVGVEFENCLGVTSGKKVLIDGSKADKIRLNLPSGERSFGCNIKINIAPWEGIPRGTISMLYDLRYQYYTEKSVQVTVEGR